MSMRGLVGTEDLLLFLAERSGFSVNMFVEHLVAKILGTVQTIKRYGMDAQANTDIFPKKERIKPKLKSSLLRVQFRASFSSGSPKVKFNEYVNGSSTADKHTVLNNDTIVTNVTRSFDFQADMDNEYGMEFSAAVKVESLKIEEIPIDS